MAQQTLSLQPLNAPTLKFKGSDLTLSPQQTIIMDSLTPCLTIVNAHSAIWAKKKFGKVAQKLGVAKSFLHALASTIVSLDDKENFKRHLQAALHGRVWEDIVRCVWTFRGATAEEKRIIAENRNELKFYLMSCLESLKAYFDQQEMSPAQIPWEDYISSCQRTLEAVDIQPDNVESDEQEAAPNPLAQ